MDLTNNRPVFICSAIGGWYPAGLDRLERSLIFNGSAADFLFYKNEYPPYCPSHEDNPYAFKIYGFREAIRRNYKIMIHLDASFWAIQNPDKLFDIVVDEGLFGFRSGYNCAQTAPDNLLAYLGITRDEAEQIPETATGIVGINIENPNGKMVFDLWADLCDYGYFKNNRVHDPADSTDPRFLHGRQDQSAFSLALYKCGVSFLHQDYVAYHGTNFDESKCIFKIGGL